MRITLSYLSWKLGFISQWNSSYFTMKNTPLPVYAENEIPMCIHILFVVHFLLSLCFVVAMAMASGFGTSVTSRSEKWGHLMMVSQKS